MRRRLLPFMYGKKSVLPWYLAEGLTISDIKGIYAAKGAVSQASSYIPIAGTMGDLTALVPPTWNSTDGWIFNGLLQYLSTPEITITDEMTVIVRYSGLGVSVTSRSLFGCANWSDPGFGEVHFDDGERLDYYVISDVSLATTENLPVAGVLALNKNGVFINGTIVSDAPTPSLMSISASLFIGANNYDNSAAENFLLGNIQHLALYSTTLAAAQILTISNNMAAL